MTTDTLTEDDVRRLLADPSGDARTDTATKVAYQFAARTMTERERSLAEEIFRVLVRDVEVRVREALSANLHASPDVPHDVALTLARDVASVALPMLESSQVLTTQDLVEIVSSQDPDKQTAVARRSEVAAEVAQAIADQGCEAAVATLVANTGADIPEAAFERVVDRFSASTTVQAPLVARGGLPLSTVERLVTVVSDSLRAHLVDNYDLDPEVVNTLVVQSRERATVDVAAIATSDEIRDLVLHLKANGRLTPGIVVRAVCMGNIAFFEMALAVRAQVPLGNARRLVHDEGPLGLKAICDQAGVPPAALPAVAAALAVTHEIQLDGGADGRERYARKVMERVLTQYDDLGVKLERDDLDYLLARMDQLPAGPLSAPGAAGA